MKLFSKKHISSYSDEQLIPLIVIKNEKAFEELYKRYSKKMHYFFYIRLNYNRELADDMLQDLFLKLIHKVQFFDLNQQFSTWFYTIANNNCKNEYKKNTSQLHTTIENNELDLTADSIVYYNNLEDQFYTEFNYSLENELKNLKETHRTAFILKYKEDLSIKEIAKIMECSEGTIKSRLHYTVKRLAQSLAKYNTNKKTN